MHTQCLTELILILNVLSDQVVMTPVLLTQITPFSNIIINVTHMGTEVKMLTEVNPVVDMAAIDGIAHVVHVQDHGIEIEGKDAIHDQDLILVEDLVQEVVLDHAQEVILVLEDIVEVDHEQEVGQEVVVKIEKDHVDILVAQIVVEILVRKEQIKMTLKYLIHRLTGLI